MANYLPYRKQYAPVGLDCKALSFFTWFWRSFTLNQVTISMRYFCGSLRCTSKSFLSFRLSSTRLLIKWILIKKRVFPDEIFEFLVIPRTLCRRNGICQTQLGKW